MSEKGAEDVKAPVEPEKPEKSEDGKKEKDGESINDKITAVEIYRIKCFGNPIKQFEGSSWVPCSNGGTLKFLRFTIISNFYKSNLSN